MNFIEEEKNGTQPMHGVNMTPLIDVSLVIVVMLLLLTPLALESSIGLRDSTEPEIDMAGEVRRIELNIVSEDSVSVDGLIVHRPFLRNTIRDMIDPGISQVVITCNGSVSHGAFVNVIDQAKLCGAGGIAVRGR